MNRARLPRYAARAFSMLELTFVLVVIGVLLAVAAYNFGPFVDRAKARATKATMATIKGAIQAIRVARPLAYNKTLLESFTFRLVGAPEALLQRSVLYTRLINAPMSPVGHDDLVCYKAIQDGLETDGNDWISLHRGFDPHELQHIDGVYNGTNEISMRGQYRAWAKLMTMNMAAGEGR